MSIICAIKKNGVVYLGADTQSTCGNNRQNHFSEGSRKLKLLDSGIILGSVGLKAGADLIFAHPEIFTLPENGELTKRYISEIIVPKIDACLAERDLIDIRKNDSPAWTSKYIIAYKDKLFWLTGKGNVVTVNHFVSLGVGDDTVYPGLSKLDGMEKTDTDEINEKLTQCLRVSACRKTGISAPFYLIDTEHQQFKLVE